MSINPVVLSIPIYFLLIGIELLVQQFSHRKLYRLNDAITNISCGIASQLSGIFFKVLGVGAYALVYEYFALYTIPSTWYSFIILFVLADFCYYWAHRMSHEINLFWGGHVVHHQSEDYNFSVALRQGSFQIIWTFAFYLPLAVIGFNPIDFVFISALVTVYQFWIHTETIGKLGVLELVFNTPSHHRVHHGRDPKYIDKNHAGVFIIWDRMFGTFQEEEERPTYGITKPVNSWNPVWVNFDHYVWMWHQIKNMKGLSNKLKFIFYKPGWFPEEMGGYQAAPHVDKASYQKYNTLHPLPLNSYVLFQYLLVLGGTAFFLFNSSSFSWIEKSVIVGVIIWVIVNCGALFEMRNWVWIAEKFRIILFTGSVILYHQFVSPVSMVILLSAVSYGFISFVWLFMINFAARKTSHIKA